MLQPIARRLPGSLRRLNHRANRLLGFCVPEQAEFLRYNCAYNAQFASPSARNRQDTRRAKIAPLLAAGISVRAISVETGIPVGAVHRAKRYLEKTVAQGYPQAAAVSLNLPTSYVAKQDINRVMYDVRRLTVPVLEVKNPAACGRRCRHVSRYPLWLIAFS